MRRGSGRRFRRWGRMANLSDPFGHGLDLLEFKGGGYDELLTPGNDPA